MDYKQIISIADFMAYSPDQGSIHTGNTIQTSINNAISILNGFTNGLLAEVVNFNYELNQDGEAQFITDRDTTNTLYRSDSQLASLEDACLQETQYVLNMGNDLTKGSFSGSFGGVSGSRSVPLEASVVPQHVILNLQAANVYTLQEFKSVDYANSSDSSVWDPNTQITWDALNDSFMRAANFSTPNTVLAGNGGGVTNTPINSLSVAQATNANQILDIDSQYKPLNDTLALANVQQSVDSKLSVINTLQTQLQEAIDRINVFLPTINNIQTQVTNNLNSINQLVNDLRNGNVIFGNAAIDTTQTYPKNYLGYVINSGSKAWYLSQQAVPANTPITNTTYWINVSETDTLNVDLDNYYTKTESDTKFQTISGMSDYLTVANANSTFATKTQLNNYYTKTQSDARYSRLVINTFNYGENGYFSKEAVNIYAPTGGQNQIGSVTLQFIYNTNNYNSLIVQVNNPPRLYENTSLIRNITTTSYSVGPILNQNTGAIKQIRLVVSGSFTINGSISNSNQIQAFDFGISAFGVEAIQIEN